MIVVTIAIVAVLSWILFQNVGMSAVFIFWLVAGCFVFVAAAFFAGGFSLKESLKAHLDHLRLEREYRHGGPSRPCPKCQFAMVKQPDAVDLSTTLYRCENCGHAYRE